MREIKFRAWDEKEKRYLDVKTGTFPDIFQQINQGEVYFPGVVFQQYIDLKDKNGVDICEGDLWKRKLYFDGPRSKTPKKKPFIETISVITYKNGKFFPNDWNQRSYPYSTTYNDWWKNGEVTGNIYEHHHLLEAHNG